MKFSLVLSLLAAIPCAAGDLPRLTDFRVTDAAGKVHARGEWRDKKAVVLLFVATECPISNGYAPEYKALAADYAAKGIALYAVYSDPDVSAADAAKHAKDYALPFPGLLDADQKLAKATGATRTPEAVVLTPTGQVVYRGRIDNKYEPNGKRRDEATVRDLRLALDAVLAGKPVPAEQTKAVGCPIPFAK